MRSQPANFASIQERFIDYIPPIDLIRYEAFFNLFIILMLILVH